MAVGDCSAANVVELEAMRDDSSWHPCNVSPSLDGVALIVDFGSHEFRNMVLDQEEALTHLRVRSIPMCDDDCSNIQEGEHVLAVRKSQGKSLFCDAEVEKTLRVRHSKRTHCRCAFMVKWLQHDLNGISVTVPSSSIMKLATKSIREHLIVSAFLSSEKSLTCSTAAHFPLDHEGADTDLHTLLEKQIVDINNFKNASSTELSEGFLLKVEVHDKGQVLCKNDGVSGSVSLLPAQNSNRRSTRSRSKLMLDIEVKQPLPVAPSIQEQHLGNRFHLSPLGACAALASFQSKSSTPLRLDFSVCHEGDPITLETDNVAVSESGKPAVNTVINGRGKKTIREKMKSVPPTSVRRSTRKAVLEQKGISTASMREDPDHASVAVSGREVPDPQLDEINANHAEEMTKKRKLSNMVKSSQTYEGYVSDESNLNNNEVTEKHKLSSTGQGTQKSKGKVSGTSNCSKQKKTSPSTKKQQLRFSPRLRLLSQTR